MTNRIKRRTFLKGAAAATAASSIGLPTIGRAADPLVVNSYGGPFEKFLRGEIIPAFEKETGITIKLDVGLGKDWLTNLRAAGPARPPYDVLMTNETWASIEREEGFFEQIPDAKVPNMKDLWPIAKLKDNWGVIGTLSPVGIAYRTDMIKTPLASWDDLWKVPEYRGKTGLYTITNSAGYMFVLMTAKTFFGSEYEVDKALDRVKQLKPFSQVDFSGTMETLLSRGEVAIGPLDYAAWARLQKSGVKMAISTPKEGIFMFEQVFNVLKGSKNKEMGYAWINFIIRPDIQEKWVRDFYYSPVNKKTVVPKEFEQLVPIAGEAMNQIVLWDWKTANANRDRIIERWNKEMT